MSSSSGFFTVRLTISLMLALLSSLTLKPTRKESWKKQQLVVSRRGEFKAPPATAIKPQPLSRTFLNLVPYQKRHRTENLKNLWMQKCLHVERLQMNPWKLYSRAVPGPRLSGKLQIMKKAWEDFLTLENSLWNLPRVLKGDQDDNV